MEYDDTLFDDMNFPADFDDSDKGAVIYNILLQCAELEVIYPDWDFMHDAIGLWSYIELPTWERLEKMALLEYNPIENYDRLENSVDSESRKRDTTRNDSIENASRGNTVNNNDTLNKVAGFNDNALGVKSKTTTGDVSSASNSGESKQILTEGETDNTGRVHSSRIHGNIGVTTPAQMITSEIELAPKLNVINYITEAFKRRFCLMVY